MTIKVSGNYAQVMSRWQELLKTSSVIVKQTSRVQAEVALTLIGEGFEEERDPYGRKWAAKKTDDGRKVLHGETTRLRNGWHVEHADKSGFSVGPSVEYAAYHQEPRGGSRPQRMMVPSAAKGLPAEWEEEFRAIAIGEAIAHFAEAAVGTKPSHKPRTANRGGGGSNRAKPSNNNGRRRRRGGASVLQTVVRQIRTVRRLLGS